MTENSTEVIDDKNTRSKPLCYNLNDSGYIVGISFESNSSLEEAEGQDCLLLCSWFILIGVVLVGLVSNLILIHAICFVKRFHRPQKFMLANLSITSVMTLFVYIIGNLLEQLPGLVQFNSVTCGIIAAVLPRAKQETKPTNWQKNDLPAAEPEKSSNLAIVLVLMLQEGFALSLMSVQNHRGYHIMFNCDKCSYSAPQRWTVLSHQRSVHSDLRPWSCNFPGCNYKAKRKYHLDAHNLMHTTKPEERKIHVCTYGKCEFRATTLYTLKKHRIARHTSGRMRDFQCPFCPSKFYNNSALAGHVSRHTKEKPHKCDSCKFTAINRGAIAVHVKAVHEKLKDFVCGFPGCDYQTAQSGYLKIHRQKHEPDLAARRPFPCHFADCSFRAATAVNLNIHIRARHCPQGRSRPFICPLCSKSYSAKSTMKVHVNLVHARDSTYRCDECEFTTHHLRNLTSHLSTVHGKGKERTMYKCDSCEHFSYSKVNLNLHTRTLHKGERRFRCNHAGCSYRTNYCDVLKLHVLNHHETGLEKQFPFMCSVPNCEFRRRTKGKIKAHERRHQQSDIQLRCKICPSKIFPDNQSLYFHKCIEHDKKIFRCSQCDFLAFDKRVFQRHVQSYHGATRTEVCATERTCGIRLSNRAKVGTSVCHKIPVVLLKKIRLKFM